MRKVIVIVAIIVILIVSYLLMYFFMGMKQTPPERPSQELLRKVKTAVVAYDNIEATYSATGRLGSNSSVDVMAEVSGQILKGNVSLKKGQRFKKGDLLVRVFDDEAEFNLKAIKSRFLTSIANALPDFKIDFPERFDALMDFYNSIDIEKPLPDMPEIKSPQIKTFLSSRNILSDYYTIKSTEIRFQKHSIYAPFNGSYTDVYLEVGSIANTGSRIARIIRTDKLELEVPVEISNIPWLKIGEKVKVTAEGVSGEWSGNIVRVSDFLDPSSQSASVFISIESTSSRPLYEGQYLRAYFSGNLGELSMQVPRSAVYNSDEVFIVNEGKLERKIINVLKINPETIMFNGLDEGVEVVIDPLVNATPGTLVETYN